MTVFYLIRHAHAEWTPDEHRPLSAKGMAGARRIAGLLSHLPISRIYSSPYLRAMQTVEPLASRLGLPVYIEPDLRERVLGQIPAGQDFNSAVQETWKDPGFAHPGGESNAAAQRRGVAVLQRLQEGYPREHLVLSTHGNLLALVLQHFDPGIGFEFWQALKMPDVYELKLEDNQGRISRFAMSSESHNR